MIFALFMFFRKRGEKMFKDYDKYLSASLKVYLFVLIIVFIMKLVGLDYFGLDTNNNVIKAIDLFATKYNLQLFWYCITLYIYTYIVLSITCVDNSKKMKIFTLFLMPIPIISQLLKQVVNNAMIFIITDTIWLFVAGIIYLKFILKKKVEKYNVANYFLYFVMNLIFQIISVCIRNVEITNENSFFTYFIINFDYLLMSIIAYTLFFMKGGKSLWVEVAYGFSLKKINLKKSLTKLQEELHNFKKQDKVYKLTFIIYFTLSVIWNTLSLILILLVAKLNDTFIECIFILNSFWLSKKIFGKAFHLSSMTQCFIVSNLTYYTLNRITTPLGISILIPIMLGVGLSYFTSKLVKKTYKPLYRGMPKELFEETILKVVDKESDKYKICYDYFINKKNALYLAGKYNYSEAGIRKIKDRVNNKIKELK